MCPITTLENFPLSLLLIRAFSFFRYTWSFIFDFHFVKNVLFAVWKFHIFTEYKFSWNGLNRKKRLATTTTSLNQYCCCCIFLELYIFLCCLSIETTLVSFQWETNERKKKCWWLCENANSTKFHKARLFPFVGAAFSLLVFVSMSFNLELELWLSLKWESERLRWLETCWQSTLRSLSLYI